VAEALGREGDIEGGFGDARDVAGTLRGGR